MYYIKNIYNAFFKRLVLVCAWICKALIVQLFLLSISFPVLVSWGIPFSPLVFLGNILFTPLLTIFLALSCVLYSFELCGIPHHYICAALELCVSGWLTVMSWAPDVVLIACPQAPWWLLVMMPLGSWVIVKTSGLKNYLHTIFFLLVWMSLIFFALRWHATPVVDEQIVACGTRHIALVLKEKKVTLIDHESALQSRACSPAWIDYTLSSQLVKNFGVTTIDAIMVHKVTPSMVPRLKALCTKFRSKKIVDMQGEALALPLHV